MCIIFRLICEILSGIAVEIRFLGDSKHGVYGAASFIAIVRSWYLRKDIRKFTWIILYMNIICIAQWLFDDNSEILHCSGAFERRHKHCKPECSFMQTHVYFFYGEKMTSFLHYVTATLRTLYCVTRLINNIYYNGNHNHLRWTNLHLLPASIISVLLRIQFCSMQLHKEIKGYYLWNYSEDKYFIDCTWESDAIMLMAPMSWRMSSAAIVSARIRDSANATSSFRFL